MEVVEFTECKDNSPAFITKEALEMHSISKIESDVVLEGDHYETKKASWSAFHSRDVSNTFSEIVGMKGLQKHSLVFSEGSWYK